MPDATPPNKPIDSPIITGRKPSNKTNRNTSPRCAPSAIRIPISQRVALRDRKAPERLIAANSRERNANARTSIALKLWLAVDLPRISCIVRISYTGCAVSSAAICRSTGGDISTDCRRTHHYRCRTCAAWYARQDREIHSCFSGFSCTPQRISNNSYDFVIGRLAIVGDSYMSSVTLGLSLGKTCRQISC